jgi:ATP-dependent Clp protease protease subunit
MAGTKVLMAPTALMMIHNPLTVAIGDTEEMQKAIDMLSEVKESIINAYEIKTEQSRAKISHLMDGETYMNANKAIELGFADGILEDAKRGRTEDVVFAFSRRAVTNSLINKLIPKSAPKAEKKPENVPKGVSITEAMQKLQARKYI